MPANRRNFTDTFLKALKPAAAGTRYSIADAGCAGLKIRVTSRGTRSFILWRRFPPAKHPAARSLGTYPQLTLEQARVMARTWISQIKEGKDPALEIRRKAAEEARQRKTTLAAVAEDFIREKLPSERKGREVARDVREQILPTLGHLPVSEIQRSDIRALIKKKKATAPGQARILLGYCKRLFSWAIDQEIYGLTASPCTEIRTREIIGDRPVGERTLADTEMRAFWLATETEAYPYRQLYRLLALTGLRLSEVADGSWPEFDFARREWEIPAARMKGRNGHARPHLVPLTDEMLKIIGTLPTFAGPYLFSWDCGKSPTWINHDVRTKLHAKMMTLLQQWEAERGGDPSKVKIEHWVNHDLRRTMRTNLSRLKDQSGRRISEEVKEIVIAHAPGGLAKTYDKHQFADEKFEALVLWNDALMQIVDPPSQENVVQMRKAG